MVDDFFEGVEQFESSLLGRSAPMPTFYRDARSFTVVLPANLMALKRILPDPRFVPAQIFPGIGGINLTAFEYRETDIDPYNEFAIGILLNSPHFMPIPGYNILRQLRQGMFCTYIQHLPVTTEIAREGGIQLFNFPKFLASIDFEDSGDWISCSLAEGDDLICRVRGRKIPARKSGTIKFLSSLYQDMQPQQAEFKINAREHGVAPGPGRASVELGSRHPFARELSSLLLSRQPLVYIYMPSMQGILYGPEHLSLASVAFFLERGAGIPLDDLKSLLAKQGSGKKKEQ